MKHSCVNKIAMLSFALSLAVSAFAQGLYWQSKTTGSFGERVSDMYAVPKKLKIAETGKEQTVTIIRLDKEVMWRLNPEKKTYSEMTFAQLEAATKKMGGKMDAQMSKMQDKLKDMPEEQRKMVEKMMGSKMGVGGEDKPVTVENTGEKKTISGFATTKYIVKRGDEDFMTLWVTRDVRGFDELRDDWKAFSRRMAAMTPRFGKEIAEAYKNIDGFPIQTETAHGFTTVVTKVERRATPAGDFEIPAGYTKVKSEMDDAMEKMNKTDEDDED